MHLGELELGLGADTLRESCVADHVSEGLAEMKKSEMLVTMSIGLLR